MTYSNKSLILCLLALPILTLSSLTQGKSLKDQGKAAEVYLKHCASCHGDEMQGGMAPSLLDKQWRTDGSDKALTDAITNGIIKAGMPAWDKVLDDEQVRSLVILIREQHEQPKASVAADQTYFETKLHNYQTTVAGEGTNRLWAADFLTDGSLLATQRDGILWRFYKGERYEIKGTPEVWHHNQGGLLDVFVHPDQRQAGEKNPWVYLSFSEKVDRWLINDKVGATTIVRGKIKNNRWVDQEILFQLDDDNKKNYGIHYGSRFAYKDGYIFFSTGEENTPDKAQDLSVLNGKIHRIHDDGRIPKDNPFVKNKSAMHSVWSYGHRNPQGLDMHPLTGELFESEHGPRGGDEINIILPGKNYGWPKVTYGMHYDGRPMTATTSAPGMEDPIHYWVPSIATCGIEFYDGDKFPKWKNQLFVAGLRSNALHRLNIQNGKVIEEERILSGLGRVRDMAVGPEGDMYVVVNRRDNNRVLRLSPADKAPQKMASEQKSTQGQNVAEQKK